MAKKQEIKEYNMDFVTQYMLTNEPGKYIGTEWVAIDVNDRQWIRQLMAEVGRRISRMYIVAWEGTIPIDGWRDALKDAEAVTRDKPCVFLSDNERGQAIVFNNAYRIDNEIFPEEYIGFNGAYSDLHFFTKASQKGYVEDVNHPLFMCPNRPCINYMPNDIESGKRHYQNQCGWGKIAYGVRMGGRPEPEFFVSWTNLIASGMKFGDVVLQPAVSLTHANAAEFLVEHFFHTSCDTLMLLDDDMCFDADSVAKLRQTGFDYAVLSGLYISRRPPYSPVVLREIAEKKVAYIKNMENMQECDVVGLGFVMIRRHTVCRVKAQYGRCFQWEDDYGEDGLFCKRVRDMGMRVGVNTDISIGHKLNICGFWDKTKRAFTLEAKTFGIGDSDIIKGVKHGK